jgi:small redox-active disulfide protein 2
MKITIYGPGCHRCHETEQVVRSAVAELGIAADIDKVSDLKAIIAAGVIATPAVAIDGEIKLYGRIPSPAEIRSFLDHPEGRV